MQHEKGSTSSNKKHVVLMDFAMYRIVLVEEAEFGIKTRLGQKIFEDHEQNNTSPSTKI